MNVIKTISKLVDFAKNKHKTKKMRSLDKIGPQNLKSICPDTNICFAFGIETLSIKQYFNRFDNFNLIVAPIIKIGDNSSNAIIQELQYEKNNYTAFTVLKTSLRSKSDNLYYEYLVGQKINTFHKFIPSFVETFDIYQYKNKIAWEFSKNNSLLSQHQIKFLFENLKNISGVEKTLLVSQSCERSKYLAIMIQLIKPAISINYLLKDNYFVNYLLLPIIFQIYTTLYTLRDSFTHYDLHYENIILYTPHPNSYIHYHYHIGNTVLQFKSPFMVKIIDYGRSYAGVGNVRDDVCKICENCGEQVGYQWLQHQKNERRAFYITPRFLNNSADLRLLYDFKRKVVSPNEHLKKMFKIRYETRYGTPEDLTFKNGEIRNIKDAFDTISSIMTLPDVIRDTDKSVANMTKFGDLEIFTDMSQPMRFTKGQS